MKKIFSLCAAVLAALTLSAQEPIEMTCAEAAETASLLEDKTTGTDLVRVTGFVTNTDGKLSPRDGINQQTFWMDDEKGTKQTFEGYWCNMPNNDEPALNVGDKVAITGYLKRYGTTMEMQNGAIEILERAIVNIDTLQSDVCETVGEALALADLEYSTDFFQLTGVVTTASDARATYNDQTFEFTCDDESSESAGLVLKVYNCALNGFDAVVLGDTVEVLGKLENYHNVAELVAGKILAVSKGGAKIDTLDVNVAEALEVAKALDNGATSEAVYHITGYVVNISTPYSEQYKNISFYLSDEKDAQEYEFQGYRVAGGEDLQEGDQIVLTGRINHYFKAATEEKPEVHGYQTPAGATYEILSVSALQNTTVNAAAAKQVRNGQLIIVREGAEFNAQGARL